MDIIDVFYSFLSSLESYKANKGLHNFMGEGLMENKKMVKIDLSALHELSPPDFSAVDILSTILDKWGFKYKILMNCSFNEGRVIFDEEFAKFIEDRMGSEEEIVKEFAERKRGIAVKLFDGYEWAYAVIL